jgi:serine/threonine-protein kinase
MLGRPRALAAALASLLAAAPVMAQPKGSNRPPQDVANDLVKQAISKSQAGDHLAAIDLYLAAYSLIPQHPLLSNVGAEYEKAGKPVEALKYFCMYLEKDPTGTNATYATSKAKALQIELGNKDVDDRSVCKTPQPPPPPPPPDTPVTGTKGLEKKPPTEPKDTGGSSGGTLKLVGVTAGVIGLVGVGIGTYYGKKALDRSDFISNHDPKEAWPDRIRELEAEGEKWEDRQIQLTIAGGVVTVAGVVMFIIGATRSSSTSTERLSIRPTAAPGSVGLSFGRGF